MFSIGSWCRRLDRGVVGVRTSVRGLGQWSDGRVGNYQQLVDRLNPLPEAISKNVGDYESENRPGRTEGRPRLPVPGGAGHGGSEGGGHASLAPGPPAVAGRIGRV
ncbi:hypothetical protein [Streptomyces sp. NPDC059874]|uniref:hypothetical protein n=1 Tax=Streptomyces sp. NPDC059874 TaxID=3346983 RepID=UPI00366229AE